MRRGSIITRYQQPSFRTAGPQPLPTIPAYTRGYRVRPMRQALGSNGESQAGIRIPVTFPMIVTGAVVLGVGMTLWHVLDSASKAYR